MAVGEEDILLEENNDIGRLSYSGSVVLSSLVSPKIATKLQGYIKLGRTAN